MSVHILGIRHHGPGSARHVLQALEALKPDIILVEGPPEGEALLKWVGHADLRPPVALLAYVPDNPQQAVFYPFTDFSPEWNAIRYANGHRIPVRFIDMPLVHKLAAQPTKETEETVLVPEVPLAEEQTPAPGAIRRSPLSYLAEIAGFDDAEDWWEQRFETAHHPEGVFEAVGEAMGALREHAPDKDDPTENIREAFMRRGIRTAQKEMYNSIVVVCGAWHGPALAAMPPQKEDEALLKNLPKTKIEATWVPWTNDRLSFESGYGAGVHSPGWYGHCWEHPTDDGTLWLTHSARVFRANRVDISSAHIIEAVRLANELAALRNRSRASLGEMNEATQTVMCMGDAVLMEVIRKQLIIGHRFGAIPEGTPQVPLQRDLETQLKKLRLKMADEPKTLTLDLRQDTDLQRSILFHRLSLLGIDWAGNVGARGKGTFKEEWVLKWYPELNIRLIEKAAWGNTVEAAGNQYLVHKATGSTRLDDITAVVQKALPAELHQGIQKVLARMDELAASTSDTAVLMDAFTPLVQVSRYGNVRRTDMETIRTVLDSIFYRLIAGLPVGCTGIDEEQAASMSEKIKEVNRAVLLLDEAELLESWFDTLQKIITNRQAAAGVHGCCCKLLYDAGRVTREATAAEFSKALSLTGDPAYAANWVEGFLKDAATVLMLDDEIWGIVNGWVASLHEDAFMNVIPLLRRTFSLYSQPEKIKIAERAKQGRTAAGSRNVQAPSSIDKDRADRVLPILEKLMAL